MTDNQTNDLFAAIHTLRSVRRFRPDPVPDDILRRILDAATRAGSGRNKQPWRFLVLRDPAVKQRIGEIYRTTFEALYGLPSDAERIKDPAARRVTVAAAELAQSMGEAPILILACFDRGKRPYPTPGGGPYASVYPAIQNLLLAARGLGLGSTLTTMHLIREAEVKELLDIPKQIETVALMPLGYPAEPFGPLTRRPVEEVTYLDRWDNPWPGA